MDPYGSVGHARNLSGQDRNSGPGPIHRALEVPTGNASTIGGVTDPATPATPNGEKPAPPPTTTLVLVRHAVTAQTGPLLSGRAPGIDLSEKGVGQAEAVGARLAVLPVRAVYASPIERTRQTAEHIAGHHGLAVTELPGVI